ncbi:MAG: ABC transporter substrate-binding protein, partial [Verrucomicrobiota bacterium]
MTTRSKVHLALAIVTALAFSGCSDRDAGTESSDLAITVQLDWVAEPEHGAFYTAEALGYFKEVGLDVTLIQGGAGALPLNKVGSNFAQIGQADGTSVIMAIAGGAPLLNVAAIFQQDPSVLMLHKSNP